MPYETRAERDKRDPLSYRIIGCAIAVHRELGPGLLESSYEDCMDRALDSAGLRVTRQPVLDLKYEGAWIGRRYRPDFVVNDEIVVEVKSVAHLLPVHDAQLLTYMRVSGIERGLLINFNVEYLIRGVRRLILTKKKPTPV